MDFSEEELRQQAMELQSQFAQDDTPEQDKPAEHRNIDQTRDEETPSFKKFVFRINSDYIPLIQSLTYDERNLFLNDLLLEYEEHNAEVEEAEAFKQKLRYTITIGLLIVIGIPLMLWLVGAALDATKSNYSGMQKNFETLYKERKTNYRK